MPEPIKQVKTSEEKKLGNQQPESQDASLVGVVPSKHFDKIEDVKLLPCPMCGGTPIDSWAFAQWCIKCEDCEVAVYRGGDMKEFMPVVRAWNSRVHADSNASPAEVTENIQKTPKERFEDWYSKNLHPNRQGEKGAWITWQAQESHYASLRVSLEENEAKLKEMAGVIENILPYLADTDELGREYFTPMAEKHYKEAEKVLGSYLRPQKDSSSTPLTKNKYEKSNSSTIN